jgi:hypothetical protein
MTAQLTRTDIVAWIFYYIRKGMTIKELNVK